MRKKSYKGELLFVVVSTFLFIVLSVGFDIYNRSVMNTLDKTLQFQILPITPIFNMETIAKLRARTKLAPIFTSSGRPEEDTEEGDEASAAASLTPTPTVVPSITTSPQQVVASEGAGLSL